MITKKGKGHTFFSGQEFLTKPTRIGDTRLAANFVKNHGGAVNVIALSRPVDDSVSKETKDKQGV